MTGVNSNRPIIIKKKRSTPAQAAHGGAWKVAYADFVTAMMAFFLLMWLLNVASEDQKKGLSDYFNQTIQINRSAGGGEGFLNGETMFSDASQAKNGSGGLTELQAGSAQLPDEVGHSLSAAEIQKIVDEALFDRGGESRTMEQLLRHVITRVTDEGLVIEIFDLDDVALFDGNTAFPSEASVLLSGLLVEVLNKTRNQIAITGHLRQAQTFDENARAWSLSSARAQSFRGLLENQGLGDRRVQRVTGYADRAPAISAPNSIRNNRVEIILLRRDR